MEEIKKSVRKIARYNRYLSEHQALFAGRPSVSMARTAEWEALKEVEYQKLRMLAEGEGAVAFRARKALKSFGQVLEVSEPF